MVIEEFIQTYADAEMNKLNKIQAKSEEEDVDSLDLTPAARMGSRKATSGRMKSPRAHHQSQ